MSLSTAWLATRRRTKCGVILPWKEEQRKDGRKGIARGKRAEGGKKMRKRKRRKRKREGDVSERGRSGEEERKRVSE